MCSQIDEDIPPEKWLRIAKSIAQIKKKHKPTPPIKAHGRIHFHPEINPMSPMSSLVKHLH